MSIATWAQSHDRVVPVAVVTGSASGIGASTVRLFRETGWVVVGLDLAPSDDARWTRRVDVADPGAVSKAVAAVEAEVGPIEAVVSAAGVYEMLPFDAISRQGWDGMLRLHVGGLLNLLRAAVPAMTARGRGAVVAVTSELAIGGGDGDAHYAAAKGAMIGLVRAAAAELAPVGIRVNAVAPGATDTPMLPPNSPWRAPAYLATLPLRRLADPVEVAGTIRWLVEEGTFSVGDVLSVNAGAVI